MRRPDDSTVDPPQYALIRRHARHALEAARAVGRFPTPVADVTAAARLVVPETELLSEGLLARLRRRAGSALRTALSKVRGVLDAVGRSIYIDRTIHVVKQVFVTLHETAHAILPWQRELYRVVEDCDMTIAPEVSEQFEREANVFACEVLFQLDAFTAEAADQPLNILVPVRLSKKFGASIYAAVRRYVSKHQRACCVLVIDPPQAVPGDGFVANLRRIEISPEFRRLFGEPEWPECFTPDDQVGALIPIGGRKMSRPRSFPLVDRNGTRHECVAEAFTQSHQVFVLVHTASTLTKKTVILSA